MKHRDRKVEERRSVITGLGIAAAGIAATAATSAEAQQSQRFMPARHRIDAWMDELGGKHRVFIDSATAAGGGAAMLYANNLYGAQENAYAGSDSDLAMIICFRHFSTPFGERRQAAPPVRDGRRLRPIRQSAHCSRTPASASVP